MTDPEILRTLRAVWDHNMTEDHAYGLLRQERDDRTRIAKYDFLKLAGFLFVLASACYTTFYFFSPSPCH